MTQPPEPTVTAVDLTGPFPSRDPFLAADWDLFLWLVGQWEQPHPLAMLEVHCEAALRCPRFAEQLALMDEHLDCDLAQLPPPVREKFEEVLRAMVLTAGAG